MLFTVHPGAVVLKSSDKRIEVSLYKPPVAVKLTGAVAAEQIELDEGVTVTAVGAAFTVMVTVPDCVCEQAVVLLSATLFSE